MKRMRQLVVEWLADGHPKYGDVEVCIFTARNEESYPAIRAWCLRHLGRELPITNVKDWSMVEFWDDRAVQVIPNTGRRADGSW